VSAKLYTCSASFVITTTPQPLLLSTSRWNVNPPKALAATWYPAIEYFPSQAFLTFFGEA
jgi:hypothetical protein